MFSFLTIAGSDNSGGAGVQADLKIATLMGGFASSVITALAVQNSSGVMAVTPIQPKVVVGQLETILQDLSLDVIKIGMLHQKTHLEEILRLLVLYPSYPIILDPIIISSSGKRLLEETAIPLMLEKLLPRTLLVTPNMLELSTLTGMSISNNQQEQQAVEILLAYGVQAVLVKGGHRIQTHDALDRLYEGKKITEYRTKRFAYDVHGTGCALSSLIACFVALGHPLSQAVALAKEKIQSLFETAIMLEGGYYFQHAKLI